MRPHRRIRFLLAGLLARHHWLTATLLALAAAVGAPCPVSAAPIAASFKGTITELNDPESQLDPVIQVGADFIVSYSIDPDAAMKIGCQVALLERGTGVQCSYTLPAESLTGALVIEGSPYTVSSARVLIRDDFRSDDPSVVPVPIADGWRFSFNAGGMIVVLAFFDNTTTQLATPRSFFVNESLEGWDGGVLSLYAIDGGRSSLAAGVVIPEPSTLPLALAAIIGLIACRRLAR